MTRFSVLTLFGIALIGLAQGNPLKVQNSLDNTPVHATEGWEWDNCGLPEDAIQLQSITVSPDPPKPGQDLIVNVVAEATEVIEEGAYADVTVKLGLIKLLQKQFDVCEEARNAKDIDIRCPVQTGVYNVTTTVALPREIPRAKFGIEVRGYSVHDDPLVCVNLKVDFMWQWVH